MVRFGQLALAYPAKEHRGVFGRRSRRAPEPGIEREEVRAIFLALMEIRENTVAILRILEEEDEEAEGWNES